MNFITNQPACAACKYQRRKCSVDCQLAPYFPADQQRQFLNVHRLFGVSNVLRILSRVSDSSQKSDAIKSIVFEAEARALDPVYGCLGIVILLQNQVRLLSTELNSIRNQILNLLNHRHSSARTQLTRASETESAQSSAEQNNTTVNKVLLQQQIISNSSRLNSSLNVSELLGDFQFPVITNPINTFVNGEVILNAGFVVNSAQNIINSSDSEIVQLGFSAGIPQLNYGGIEDGDVKFLQSIPPLPSSSSHGDGAVISITDDQSYQLHGLISDCDLQDS